MAINLSAKERKQIHQICNLLSTGKVVSNEHTPELYKALNDNNDVFESVKEYCEDNNIILFFARTSELAQGMYKENRNDLKKENFFKSKSQSEINLACIISFLIFFNFKNSDMTVKSYYEVSELKKNVEADLTAMNNEAMADTEYEQEYYINAKNIYSLYNNYSEKDLNVFYENIFELLKRYNLIKKMVSEKEKIGTYNKTISIALTEMGNLYLQELAKEERFIKISDAITIASN